MSSKVYSLHNNKKNNNLEPHSNEHGLWGHLKKSWVIKKS